MQIHNTLGRQMVSLEANDRPFGIYVCGPTVQAQPHLGHGRSAVVFDVIRRYLTWRGFSITYVRNVTDVDDKIIAAAQARGVPIEVIVAESFATFSKAEEALGVLRPDIEPRATEHIPEMIELISTLMDVGLAYPVNGDVYFRVRAYPGYGKLSGRDVDDLLSGARVEVGDAKEDPLDFALWKAAKPGEPTWDAPWGAGRPGWHIECSAMARKHLGDTVDIHGGGTDLIFPHHENELAQSEGATGQPFARFWVHNGMLTLGGEKMAKSTGHVIGLIEALEKYNPMAIRLYYLRAHYRSLLEYSPELLDDAASAYMRLTSFARRAQDVLLAEPDPDLAVMDKFIGAMDDDFSTPVALSVLFDTIRDANRRFDSGERPAALAAAVMEILEVLGLEVELATGSLALNEQDDSAVILGQVSGPDLAALTSTLADLVATFRVTVADDANADESVSALIAARQEARQSKDWARSDAIRDGLAELGIILEDTADGVRWHRQ